MLFLVWNGTKAQTGGEWFNQKKTQKKYLLAQIAALQYYIGVAQKGYKIAKDGLSTIGQLSKGEFNLHGDYFNSLKKVNPEVKNYAKVADIISLQVKIVSEYHKVYNSLSITENFSPNEMDYVKRVYKRLLDDCGQALDQLIAVTTDNQLEMKDDERMETIDHLYLQMMDNYAFCKNFGNNSKVMAVNRTREKNEVLTGRALHGIQNP